MSPTADEAANAVMATAVAAAIHRLDLEGARVTTRLHQMSQPSPRRVRTAPAGRPPRPAPRCGRPRPRASARWRPGRSEEHTSELQSLMRNSYAVFCLKKKKHKK